MLISGGLSDNPPILCAPITSASRTYRPQYYQYWRPFDVALDRRWANVLPTDAQISEPTDTYSRATFAPTALYAAGAKSDPLGRSTLSGATRHLTQLRGSGDRTRSDLFVLSAESEGDANFSMIVGEIPRYGMCKNCMQQKTALLVGTARFLLVPLRRPMVSKENVPKAILFEPILPAGSARRAFLRSL